MDCTFSQHFIIKLPRDCISWFIKNFISIFPPAGAGLRPVSCFVKAKYYLPLMGKATANWRSNLRQRGPYPTIKTEAFAQLINIIPLFCAFIIFYQWLNKHVCKLHFNCLFVNISGRCTIEIWKSVFSYCIDNVCFINPAICNC